jgi:hypothetical protein
VSFADLHFADLFPTDLVITALLFAVIINGVVEYLVATAFDKRGWDKWPLMYIAWLFSTGVCVAFRINLLAGFIPSGMDAQSYNVAYWTGIALTAVLISRGSNWLADFFGLVVARAEAAKSSAAIAWAGDLEEDLEERSPAQVGYAPAQTGSSAADPRGPIGFQRPEAREGPDARQSYSYMGTGRIEVGQAPAARPDPYLRVMGHPAVIALELALILLAVAQLTVVLRGGVIPSWLLVIWDFALVAWAAVLVWTRLPRKRH